MARLQIPPPHVSGLKSLRKLSEDSIKEIAAALVNTPPMFQLEDLLASLVPQIGSISETDLCEILETLVSLSATRIHLDIPTSELVERVCAAMEQSDDDELKIIGAECDSFKNRLIGLLNIESLTYVAKATTIMTAHDHVFSRARTLTDIRAVFGPDVNAPPKGAVIIHTLNIAYYRGPESENFYVAMDTKDVESLITTLQRALSEATGLKTVLERADVRQLGAE